MAGSTFWFRKAICFARDSPIRWVSNQVPPKSPESAASTKADRNTAADELIRRSHAAASDSPAPAQAPLTAAMETAWDERSSSEARM